MESNYLKGSSIQTVHLLELKFGMCIINHHQTQPSDFGVCRIYTFFAGVDKRILIHYGLWDQIIRSVLVSKATIRRTLI